MTTSNPTIQNIYSLHQAGNIEEAILQYKAFLSKEEDNEQKAQGYELLGIAYAQSTQYESALSSFKQASKLAPAQLSIRNNIATCYKKLNKVAKAQQTYQDILKYNPLQCVTHNNLAALYIIEKKYPLAINHLKKAICLNPNYPDAYFNLGLAYTKSGSNIALKYLEKAASLGHAQAAYQAGLEHERLRDITKALKLYEQSLAQTPENAFAHHGKGRCLLAAGDDEEALASLIKAQRIDPSIPHLMENIASYYHVKGMHVNAIEYWSKAPRTPDNIIEINYNIGVAYHYANRHTEALEYFNQVLEHEPNHQNAHMNVAAIALQNNQKQSAITHYQKALSLDPNNEEIQYILTAIKHTENNITVAPKNYVANLFDQYAGHYDQHLMNMLRYQLPTKIEEILHENLKREPNYSILDLGCGTGLLGSILLPFAKELVGIDLSANMLTKAKETQLYHTLKQIDCEVYLKESKPVDIIIAAELLPYIGDVENLIHLIGKTLTPEGLLIISIEKDTTVARYKLSENARFKHNPEWITDLAASSYLDVVESRETTLRLHQSNPVLGQLMVLKKLKPL